MPRLRLVSFVFVLLALSCADEEDVTIASSGAGGAASGAGGLAASGGASGAGGDVGGSGVAGTGATGGSPVVGAGGTGGVGASSGAGGAAGVGGIPSGGHGGSEAGAAGHSGGGGQATGAGATGGAGAAGSAGKSGAAGGGGDAGNGGGPAGGGSGGAVDCHPILEAHPIEPHPHIAVCSAVSYSTNPPSSGAHYPIWAEFKVYDQPVPRGFYVHDLEHGAVVFTYNCPDGCSDQVAAATQVLLAYTDSTCAPGGPTARVVMTPDPLLDVTFAASAWGFTLRADCFDAPTFADFLATHSGLGPEDFCSQGTDPYAAGLVTPGCGM